MKKQKIVLIALMSFLTFALYSCYYDNDERLYPKANLPTNTGSTCDTSNVTYSKVIGPTVSNFCGCHGADNQNTGGGVKLDTYDDLKPMMNSVIKSITSTDPAKVMPKSGVKLTGCLKNQLTAWKNAGTPNN